MSADAAQLWGDAEVRSVDRTSPRALRQLAYEAGMVCRTDGGYDEASYPYHSADERRELAPLPLSQIQPIGADPYRMSLNGFGRAYLLREGNMVMSFAMNWPEYATAQIEWTAPGDYELIKVAPTLSCSVGPIWTAASSRRRDLGRRLLDAIAADPNRYPGPLSVLLPFSDAGAALFRAAWGDAPLYARS
ncbi:hypothetical protein [Tsukamurella tyrosinosolvens]|nr:hypothetical protein [Tsukamurella tyrosinosolvens]